MSRGRRVSGGFGDDDAMVGRVERRRARRRRRRASFVRGLIRGVFWLLVLAGVFVLGLGYGRTIARDGGSGSRKVVVTRDMGTVAATLPTKTVTKTVTVIASKKAGTGAARSRSAAVSPRAGTGN